LVWGDDVVMVERSVEALNVLRELDSELAAASEHAGRSLVWTVADKELLSLIADIIERKVDLTVLYEATPDISPRVKLSAELRLLEGALARLLRQIKTDVPEVRQQEPSFVRSARASRTSKARWYPNATG
jgi:hypothetical protein